MKTNRLVERLKRMLEAIEVEPPVPQAGFLRDPRAKRLPPRRVCSDPQSADASEPDYALKVELRARGVRVGWLAASLPPADPRYEQAGLLARTTARLLTGRLAELGALDGQPMRRFPGSAIRFIVEAGDDPFDPAVQALSQALLLNGRAAGFLQAQAAPEQADLFRSVAAILAGRLEELVLKERLERLEAEAADLRGRLDQVRGS